MTCGSPQGSRVGPFMWNVMYDDLLHMDLLAETKNIGSVDDVLVCLAGDVVILKLRINESLWRARRWLNKSCLEVDLEKTEALLVTDRRSLKWSKIVIFGCKLKTSISQRQSHSMWISTLKAWSGPLHVVTIVKWGS